MSERSGAARAAEAVDPATWERIGSWLARDSLLVIDASRRMGFLREWRELEAEERAIDDRLVIGLVGGTGVGKSTFINALAGERISKSGDRRPTTDRVIVYRHTATDLPEKLPRSDLSQPQVLHSRAPLERVAILDFPDFDSAESSHAAVLDRYLKFLDVLFIVADDVKYGDRRLYDLVRGIGHDPRNLHVILNKTDRLDERYGERSRLVAREIADDFREKLAEHAGVLVPSERVLAISALNVLENRLAGDRARREGDFDRVEDLLVSYREEKRRRAAKTLNLESRKRKLLGEIARAVLTKENQALLEEGEDLLRRSSAAMESTLGAIPVTVFSEGERARIRVSRWRRSIATRGATVTFLGTILAQWKRSRAREVEGGVDLAGRLESHYRPYLQALETLEIRLRSELPRRAAGVEREPRSRAHLRGEVEAISRRIVDVEQAAEPEGGRRRRWVVHVPALLVIGFAMWALVRRVIESLLSPDAERGFFSELAYALFTALDPFYLAGVAMSVVLAYVATVVVLWMREAAAVDLALSEAERELRDKVRRFGEGVLESASEEVRAFRGELTEIRELVSGAESTAGSD